MNELAKIAEESGLPQTKSQALLEIFQEFFGVAAEWEKEAKSIKVTDESQTDLMLKAREGRKFLQEARIKLEKTRVDQKKFALLEGKAIDGMANVLKASIVPVENYLKEQEDFVVNKTKAEALAKRIKADKLLAEQELAEEKALQERMEKERSESFRRMEEAKEELLKKEIERKKEVAKRQKVEEEQRLEREKHQKEIEDKQRIAFEKAEKLRLENEKKIAAEQKIAEEKIRKEREERFRISREAEARADAEAEKREAENKEREEKEEKWRVVGQNRQDWLFKIDVQLDFRTCANMTDEAFKKFYKEKKEEYRVSLERFHLEKQRAEKEEEEKQELLKKQIAPHPTATKCPKCGHLFIPSELL